MDDLFWPVQLPLRGPRSYFRRVPPHFLWNHANASRCRRRVYIDVGARTFDSPNSGLKSMLKLYPPLLRFDEFYAFEAVAGFYKLPPQIRLVSELIRLGMRPLDARSFFRRHFFLQAFVGARNDPSTSPPTIGFSDFLRTTLRLQPADAVVVKMDVEGFEYGILNQLLDDETHVLVDELMLEVHYGAADMRRHFNWCKTPQFWCEFSLANASGLLQTLREAGIYAHAWP